MRGLMGREVQSKFLSTPSARRATEISYDDEQDMEISIHALCEEGDPGRHPAVMFHMISIHALREEGDVNSQAGQAGRTISIHALREEGDSCTISR